ncbi:MAG: guanylate kinase [Pseudomonadales bacterium]|jgi:guanylate kinase|nr:guanylate kinase [Pseudomonadales bacterium]
MQTGNLFLVSAPSGAGKTSIVNAALAADSDTTVSVSHTTRPARGGEIDGDNYFFVGDDEFTQMIENGEFLEHANVFGKRYGTSKAEVERKRSAGKNVILEIDWQGAQQVREVLPEATSIFILPPSVEELAQRLNTRGEDSAQSIEKRLSEAKLDMSQAKHFDFLVINADFDSAVSDFLKIIQVAGLRTAVQTQRQEIVELIQAD